MANSRLHLQPHFLQQHLSTEWDPQTVQVTLNVALDGCIVPSSSAAGGARVDTAHLVVLDDFLDERARASLMEFLTERGWGGPEPPGTKWERATCDQAFLPRTWGLKDEVLQEFAQSQLWGKLEVQTRLCKLYPEVDIAHMPSDAIQCRAQPIPDTLQSEVHSGPPRPHVNHHDIHHCQQQGQQQQQQAAIEHLPSQSAQQLQRPWHQQLVSAGHQAALQQQTALEDKGCHDSDNSEEAQQAAVDCNQFVANAAIYGDYFAWHVDADPWTFPPSPWTDQYGQYVNREPGKPLFVSLLLYLDDEWPREWDAETLFLDTQSDTGIIVRPKKYRAVLMDQDVLHRLSTPSQAAQRPRYSLVWKLLFLPRAPGQLCSIARPEWGRPMHFGSAAKVEQVVKQLAGRKRPPPQEQQADAG